MAFKSYKYIKNMSTNLSFTTQPTWLIRRQESSAPIGVKTAAFFKALLRRLWKSRWSFIPSPPTLMVEVSILPFSAGGGLGCVVCSGQWFVGRSGNIQHVSLGRKGNHVHPIIAPGVFVLCHEKKMPPGKLLLLQPDSPSFPTHVWPEAGCLS